MKKVFVIIVIIIACIVLVIVFGNLSGQKKKTSGTIPSPSVVRILPSASVFPKKGEALPNSFPTSGAKDYSQVPAAIGKLVENLPYRGTLFSLSYDFSKDSFTLYLNKNNQLNAEKEFEGYLKNNNIADKNWLQNLIVVYQ